jgi:glycosyltransferase involved in cell wall biosynthesis
VRRVLELALPAIAAAWPELGRITLGVGEAGDEAWVERLRAALGGVSLEVFEEPEFRYASEQRAASGADLRLAVERLLVEADAAWVHNPALGRNLPLARALGEAAARRGIPLLFHHHDLWFENRWARWPEMRESGFRTLDAVARTVFPPEATHATINRLDHGVLRRHFGARAAWLPNPAPRASAPPKSRVRAAREWLARELGDTGPVWLCPARMLRRKNFAEAILLARWLRPEAWVVTTAAVSSAAEQDYARRLIDAARLHGWRARFELVARSADAPGIAELQAASEAILLTSVQEGFGLPYVEAVSARRPLLARRLPNVMPDLRRWGFSLPHTYEEVWIDPACLDLEVELRRQRAVWRAWRARLPANCRPLVAEPEPASPLAFSRLTLEGQLEVLARDPAETWRLCAKWNPLLRKWKPLAATGALEIADWPEAADRELGGAAYAERFLAALRAGTEVESGAPERAQADFLRQRLDAPFLIPLLMS